MMNESKNTLDQEIEAARKRADDARAAIVALYRDEQFHEAEVGRLLAKKAEQSKTAHG